jgi:cyclopropane fatty-acyl-phospholipid synthase-like methyltransferase
MKPLKKIIKRIPILRKIYRKSFTTSSEYWRARYKEGGNSGAGSYNRLAEFKAQIINSFVKEKNISTVIEFGCGDGNQLKYFDIPSYIGYDVSPEAIEYCKKTFENDKHSKQFKLLSEYLCEGADLTLSLDVVYHLVEDETFTEYMKKLFSSSEQFVIIYASNYDKQIMLNGKISHVRHRKFTDWIDQYATNFKLIKCIPNKYPFKENEPNTTSFSDFYIFQKLKIKL